MIVRVPFDVRVIVPVSQVNMHVDVAHDVGEPQLADGFAKDSLRRFPQREIGRMPSDAKPRASVRGMERSHGGGHLVATPTMKTWSATMPTRRAIGWIPNTPRRTLPGGLVPDPPAALP